MKLTYEETETYYWNLLNAIRKSRENATRIASMITDSPEGKTFELVKEISMAVRSTECKIDEYFETIKEKER